MTTTKRARTKPRPLTRQRILREAVRFADKRGVDELNMRRLAERLNCGVMSLYNHVANKDDLLDGMVDLVAAEIALPAQDVSWRAALSELALSAHETFIAHRWVNELWSHRGLGPAKLAFMEAILRTLREAGFSVALACRGYHALTIHITGFTLQEIDFPIDAGNLESAARRFLQKADPEQSPYFIEHVRHHLDAHEPNDDFVFMLEMILDGLERAFKAESGAAGKQS